MLSLTSIVTDGGGATYVALWGASLAVSSRATTVFAAACSRMPLCSILPT